MSHLQAKRRRTPFDSFGPIHVRYKVHMSVWENVSRTNDGSAVAPAEQGASDPLETLSELRASFSSSEWLANLTKEELREVVANRIM